MPNKKMVEKAHIEDFKWSIFDSKLSFIDHLDRRKMYEERKANIKITTIAWFTLQPVISKNYELYNPKTCILIYLN